MKNRYMVGSEKLIRIPMCTVIEAQTLLEATEKALLMKEDEWRTDHSTEWILTEININSVSEL